MPPPRVIDDTNPAGVMHAGDSTTPTDGQLIPDYRQLGFRVPAIVVSNLVRPHQVVHDGPFEHDSSLALIESTFGLNPLTARDRHARNLAEVLLPSPVPARFAVPAVVDPDQRGRHRPGDQPAVGVTAAGARGHGRLRPG